MNLGAALRAAGIVVGVPLALLFFIGSALRRGRVVHVTGRTFAASVSPSEDCPEVYRRLARDLQGPALVRLSNTLWKRPRPGWLDLLGCTFRFGWRRGEAPAPKPSDQDLLMTTVQHVWTLPFAPFSTDVHGFFSNHYFSVAPFSVAGIGVIRLRAVPMALDRDLPGDRADRLSRLVRERRAGFYLEAIGPLRRWARIARVRLDGETGVDQDRLYFDPYQAGRGLVPTGFINGLRYFAYPASRLGRWLTARLVGLPRDRVSAS